MAVIHNHEELEDIANRFKHEGLEPFIHSEQAVLYLWRWLVDAESNLESSRGMIEKLRSEQRNEIKGVEDYAEELRKMSLQRLTSLERSNTLLQEELDHLRHGSIEKEVSEMLTKEGLVEYASCTLSEQVAFLLAERSKLLEELQTEKEKYRQISENLTDNLKISSTQLQRLFEQQKADLEEEMLHQRELVKQVKEDMRRVHDEELKRINNELEQAERKIKELQDRNICKTNMDIIRKDSKEELHSITNSDGEKRRITEIIKEQQKAMTDLAERLKISEKNKRQLEIDNDTLVFKISELLAECDLKESQLQQERIKNMEKRGSFSRRSSQLESPKRLFSIPDNKAVTVHQEMTSTDQIKKMKSDIENLQEQLMAISNRNEVLATKYQQKKVDGKNRLQKLRGMFQTKQDSLKDDTAELEGELSVLKTDLAKEKQFRKNIQEDFALFQSEKTDLLNRLDDCDDGLREKSNELRILTQRVDHLDSENLRLEQELAAMKQQQLLHQQSTQKSNTPETQVESKQAQMEKTPLKSIRPVPEKNAKPLMLRK